MLNAHLVSPFAMLLNPEHVIQAVEHSELLNHLNSHIYHPLDKPLIVKGLATAAADFDRLVDEAADEVLVDVERVTLAS
ncbi:hypothetical protein ACVBEH_10775 [Roseateles sp. GG27B]